VVYKQFFRGIYLCTQALYLTFLYAKEQKTNIYKINKDRLRLFFLFSKYELLIDINFKSAKIVLVKKTNTIYQKRCLHD
jgi:hypothetical protein